MRDGRSFTTRRVVARQKDATIFVMTASFHEPEAGFDHAAPAPPAPPPEACPDPYKAVEMLEGPARFRMKGMLDTTWPVEFRPTDLGALYARRPARGAAERLDPDRRAACRTIRRCTAPRSFTCRT